MAKSSKSATKGSKRTKAKKDPNKPKGAVSGFMQFSQSERQKVKDENPDLKITEISKILGERWRNMTDSERKPFIKKATADKERYKKEMALYNAKMEAGGDEEESEKEGDDEDEDD